MKKLKRNWLVLSVLIIWINGCILDDVMLPPVLAPTNDSTFVSNKSATLRGNNFDPSTTSVYLNQTKVDLAGTPSLTEINFIVPFVTIRTKAEIYVATKFGNSELIQVAILPPISKISRVIPGQAGINKKIKIVGDYFTSVTGVQFKSSPQTKYLDADIVRVVKDTIEVVVPAGLLPDAAEIRLISQSGPSDIAAFTVLAPPNIRQVSPARAGANMRVTLTGDHFNYLEAVRIGSATAEILSNSESTIEFRVPEDAVTDTLHVMTWGGKDKTDNKFVIVPPPQITGVDKLAGSINTDVKITGTNFLDAFEVKFGNTPASVITVNSTGTSLQTKVPAGAESGLISLTTPGGTDTSDGQFEVLGAPLINSFSPSSGTKDTRVALTGFNLGDITTGKIGLKALTIISKTATTCVVEIQDGSVTGKISLTGPNGTVETITNFTVSGSPEITSISPASGIIGTIVTITGLNFPSSPSVKFGGNKQAVVSSSTPTQIICQVPAGSITGVIIVNGATSAEFKVTGLPVISTITPMKGGLNKEVVIQGNYLLGATVRFSNNITATKVGTDTETRIVARVPAVAVNGKITVTTPAGSASSSTDFEILPAPTITSFSPPNGTQGMTVTIIGTNLHFNPVVQFFNLATATIKSVTPTQLLVEVPLGAATGKLTVKTDAIDTPIPSAANFNVIGKPAITSIAPDGGTIQEIVIINGSNFDDIVSISFDGVAAPAFTRLSSSAIEVRVPASVSAAVSRSINVNVRTAADVSGNFTFKLLGTPSITKLSPDNNPSNWAFLIEGVNLHVVKRITLDGKVPNYGTSGIDKQGFNYITTKVPKEVAPPSPQTKTLTLYYTSDDVGSISMNYEVLSAPPPGVFPQPTIILPPPLPLNYAQIDLAAYWIDKNFVSPSGDSLRCYQLRTPLVTGDFPPFGSFCQGVRFYAIKNSSDVWEYANEEPGFGTWNNGYVYHSFGSSNYTGRVYDQAASSLVLTDQYDRQLILVSDESGHCLDAFQVIDNCN